MIINEKKRVFTYRFFLAVIVIFVLSFGNFTKEFSPIVVAFRPIIRNIENKIINYRTHKYSSIETEHFILRYEKGIDKEVIDLVARTAEDKYKSTVELFEYYPQEKILMVLYDNPEVLIKTTMLKKGSPPMGVYYGNTVHILNPTQWVKNEENLEDVFYSEGPVLHELVHLFTDHIGKGNFPLWFTEGVSLYFEYKIDGYQWGKEVIFEDREYTLEELTDNFHGLDEYLAYTQSFRMINNLVQEQGVETLMEIIKALGEGRKIEEYIHLFRNN